VGKIGYAGLLIATSLTNDTMAEVLGDRRWQPLLGRIGGEIMRAARAEAVTADRRRWIRRGGICARG